MAVDAFKNEVMADGPVGYWRLGESPGQPAADSSPNGNDGTYNGGITLGLAGFGFPLGDTAALFDGATGIIRVPNSRSLNPPSITMEAKVRWAGATGVQQRIVEKESFAGTTQYGLSVQPTGHVFVELRCPTAANVFNSVTATSTGLVAAARETHIVATYDGLEVRIYLDGVLDSVTVPLIAGAIDTSKADQTGVELELAIGDRMAFYSDPDHFQAGGTRTFKGLIDEVALYPTALAAARVHAHYQSQFAEGASFEYSAKVVCGKSAGDVVARGVYFTAINVHNPSRTTVRLRWKVATARPGAEAGPVSSFFEARLGPDEALEIDCPDIVKRAEARGFLKGFVVIESGLELDVVAVYTAAAERGQVVALHTERVPPRPLGTPPI